MPGYRALGVVVSLLSLGGIGCDHHEPTPAPVPQTHSTIAIVVASDGLTGQAAQVGDTLQWAVLNPTDLGFTVNFPFNPSPCGSNTPIKVSYGNPGSCVVVDPHLPPGATVNFYYRIALNKPSTTGPQPPVKTGKPIVFSVVPCRGCDPVDTPPGLVKQRTGGSYPIATEGTDLGRITCDSGKAAKVNDVTPDSDGNVYWSADGPNGQGVWVVDFGKKTPCTDGSVFSNTPPINPASGQPPVYSTCTVNPSSKGDYTYTVTSDTGGCKAGTGKLKTNK